MKFSSVFTPAFLVAAALASESEPASSPSADPSPSSTPSAPPKTPDPTPVGEIWTAKWKADDLDAYKRKCAATGTLNAEIYKLNEMYPKLETWAPELKVFYNKQHYPGSWRGEDKHGGERELLKMGLADVPFAVREWIKTHPKQRHFSVQDDIVFFAPGAIYPILPLFVDEAAEGTDCDNILEDLDNYSAEVRDGAVLGTVEHRKGEDKAVEIVVSAFQAVKAEKSKDEL